MVIHVMRFALLTLAVACAGPSSNKPKHVVTSETSIEILDPVSFTNGAELAPKSHEILDAVASTLDGNPSIKLVEVEAHVVEGDESARQQLADRRAQVIIDYLVGKGVAAARLRPKGLITPSDAPKDSVSLIVIERSSP